MDVTSLAAAMVGAQAGRVQLAVAARMMKMNFENTAAIAKLVEAGQQNLGQLANVAAGIGQNLDISV